MMRGETDAYEASLKRRRRLTLGLSSLVAGLLGTVIPIVLMVGLPGWRLRVVGTGPIVLSATSLLLLVYGVKTLIRGEQSDGSGGNV